MVLYYKSSHSPQLSSMVFPTSMFFPVLLMQGGHSFGHTKHSQAGPQWLAGILFPTSVQQMGTQCFNVSPSYQDAIGTVVIHVSAHNPQFQRRVTASSEDPTSQNMTNLARKHRYTPGIQNKSSWTNCKKTLLHPHLPMSCSNTAKVATGRLWQKGAAKSLSMCRRCSKWRASIWPFIATDSLNDLTPVCPGPLVSRISMTWLRTCQRGLINLFLHLEAFSFEVMLPRQQHSHQLPAWKRPRMLKTLSRWASWSTMRINHLGAKATSLHATPEGKDKRKEMRTKTTIKKK